MKKISKKRKEKNTYVNILVVRGDYSSLISLFYNGKFILYFPLLLIKNMMFLD